MKKLWSRTERTDSGCVIWKGFCDKFGYGMIRVPDHKSQKRTHRLSWELENGPIPKGVCVLHRCDNPPCLNPEHLFLGTKADNVADMDRKGRRGVQAGKDHYSHTNPEKRVRGSAHGQSKMTETIVREIREKHRRGYSYRALARDLGLDPKTIKLAVTGQTWSHVV